MDTQFVKSSAQLTMKIGHGAVKGFTLIELSLAVLITVAVLAGIGYLYNNAAVTNLGVITANESVSAATLCLAQETGVNSGCNSLVEKGAQVVTNVTSGSPSTTATQVIVLTYAGPLAKKLSGGKSGITRNACYVVYAALNKAGLMVVKTGTTRPAGAVASISAAVACTPAATGVVAGLSIAKNRLN